MQVLAHARRILLSTICLYHHHLIPLRVLVCFVLCFFFLLLRPRASALTTTSLLEVVLSVNGWSRARRAVSPIFNRDSPLHLILRLLSFLISAFSREPGNGNLLFILRFCNYQLPSYTSIRRRLSLSLSFVCVLFIYFLIFIDYSSRPLPNHRLFFTEWHELRDICSFSSYCTCVKGLILYLFYPIIHFSASNGTNRAWRPALGFLLASPFWMMLCGTTIVWHGYGYGHFLMAKAHRSLLPISLHSLSFLFFFFWVIFPTLS